MTICEDPAGPDRMSRKNLCSFLFIIIVLGLAVPECQGALIINVGNFNLLPNAAGQVVEVYVQNTGGADIDVVGVSINVQVADSGPSPGFGSDPGPHITAVDIITGTVFQP